MGVTHTWQGVRQTGERGWVEFFRDLPKRDLTDEDVAGFDEQQRAELTSEAGQRLYVPVEVKAEPESKRKRSSDAGVPDTDETAETVRL